MSRRRRNKNTVSSAGLPPSVGVRTPRRHQQQLLSSIMSSSPLPSDASTPSPRFEESQQPTQIHDTLLGDDSPIKNMQTLDSLSVDGEDYEVDSYETDGSMDEGSGNLAVYKSFPKEVLKNLSELDQSFVERKYSALKDFMDASGKDFSVQVRRFDTCNNFKKDNEAAVEFEQEFSEAMLTKAGLDRTHELPLEVLLTLSMQETRWEKKKTKEREATIKRPLKDKEKEQLKEETKQHKELTKRYEEGCKTFIKNQFKQKGETAFDDAPGDSNKGIFMSHVKNTYLPKILCQMSLNSAKNDDSGFKTLFMADHVGDEIKVGNSKWPGSTTFNRILRKDRDSLWEAAKREREEEEEESRAISQATLQALKVENAQRASGHELSERFISRLHDQNAALIAQNEELRQDLRQAREAAKESFQELKDSNQSLVNENKHLRQRIKELEAKVNSATNTKPSHSFATPLKDTKVKDETQSLHQHLTADLSSLCQIGGIATNVPSSNNMNFENTVIHIHTPFRGPQNEED